LQVPYPRFSKFHAVAGGIASVKRAASAGPFELGLNGYGTRLKATSPAVKFRRRCAKTNVPGAPCAMGRHGQSAAGLCRCSGVEDQEHLLTACEKNMAALFYSITLQPEHMLIEVSRRGKIVRIESRLQYPGGHHRRSGHRLLLQGDKLGYSCFGETEHFQKPRLGEGLAFSSRLNLDDAACSGRNEIGIGLGRGIL
jgi:hypothetical protein